MKQIRKFIISALVISMIMSIAFFATGCSSLNVRDVSRDPEKQIMESFKKTIEVIQAGNATSPLAALTNILNNGTITLSMGDEESGLIKNELYMNAETGKIVNKLSSEMYGEKMFTDIYFDGEKLVFASSDLLKGKAFGVNIKTLEEDMKNSAIWDLMGITYEDFMAENGDMIKELEKLGADDAEADDITAYKQAKKLMDDIHAIIAECQVDVVSRTVITDSDTSKAINITYQIATEQLQKLADILVTWYGENLAESMQDFEEDGFASEPIDITAEIEAMKAEIKEQLGTSKAALKITFSINPKSQVIMKTECEFTALADGQTEYAKVTLDLGEDPAASAAYELRASISNGSRPETSFSMKYERMDAKSVYDRRLYITISDDMGGENTSIRFVIDYEKNVYNLIFDTIDQDLTIIGMYKSQADKLEVSVDTIVEGKDSSEVGLKIVAEPGKEIPTIPEFTNIFSATEDELSELLIYIGGAQGPDYEKDWDATWDEDWDDDYEDWDGASW